jgi:hypothetical protein
MIRYGADLFPVCRAAPYQAGACTAATYVRAAHHERGEHHPQAQQHSSRRTRPSRGDADADVPPTAPGHARHAAAAAAASRPMIPPRAGEMIERPTTAASLPACHSSSLLARAGRGTGGKRLVAYCPIAEASDAYCPIACPGKTRCSPSPRLTRRSLRLCGRSWDGITTRQKPPGHTKALRRHGMESSIPCACSQRRYPSSPPLLPCCLLLHDSLLDPWASKLAPGHKLPQPIGSGRRGGGFGFGLRPTCLPPTSIHGSGHCNPGPPNLPDSHRSLDAKHCRRVPCHRLTALASQFHDQWAWIPSTYIMIKR